MRVDADDKYSISQFILTLFIWLKLQYIHQDENAKGRSHSFLQKDNLRKVFPLDIPSIIANAY